jgi:hypothetical protein
MKKFFRENIMAPTTGPLATVLSGIARYETQVPFINHFKTAQPWVGQRPGVFDVGVSLNLDADGWVTSIPQGPDAAYTSVATLVLPPGQAQRPGRYVVSYQGEGELNFSGNVTRIDAESRPGYQVIDVKPALTQDDGSVIMSLSNIDPNRTGNYIRDIKFVHQDDLPLLEMGLKFTPQFLQNLSIYRTLSTSQWQATNRTPEKTWDQRAQTSDATYMQQQGVPIETIVDLANQAGTDAWLHVPKEADDAYIRQMATLVKERLNPNLKVYIEFASEGWGRDFEGRYPGNYFFEQAAIRWAPYWQSLQSLPANQGKTLAQIQEENVSYLQYYATRTAEMSQIWDQVFGADASRLQTVYTAQAVTTYFSKFGLTADAWADEQRRQGVVEANIKRPSQFFDSIAIAPYLGTGVGSPGNQATLESWLSLPDGGRARLTEVLRTGGYIDETGNRVEPWDPFSSLPALRNSIQAYKTLSDQYGLSLISYEGGQSIRGLVGLENNVPLTNFFNEFNRSPEMGQLYSEYLAMWQEVTGNTLFTHFVDTSAYSKWGSWGAKEYYTQGNTPKYDALSNYSDTRNNIGLFTQGDAANNTLIGGEKSDTLLGGAGADNINGGNGDDYLHGGLGNDLLLGGAGKDVLLGSEGNDTMTGGAGIDEFRFTRAADGSDTITDFSSGGAEKILLQQGEFAGLAAASGTPDRLANGQYGEGNSLMWAAMMARMSNGWQPGAAVLAVSAGSRVQVYYDPNTGVANNETLLATLQSTRLNQVSIDNFSLFKVG